MLFTATYLPPSAKFFILLSLTQQLSNYFLKEVIYIKKKNKYVICARKCKHKLNYRIVCAVCINKFECDVLDPYSNLILI